MSHERIKPKHIFINLKLFLKEMSILVTSPAFILLTIFGNSVIGLFSMVFYLIESGSNPNIKGFIDALWWGFSTATTTGYGDITPVTSAGKVLGIFLMLTGMALFAMFTALFAETILINTRQTKK